MKKVVEEYLVGPFVNNFFPNLETDKTKKYSKMLEEQDAKIKRHFSELKESQDSTIENLRSKTTKANEEYTRNIEFIKQHKPFAFCENKLANLELCLEKTPDCKLYLDELSRCIEMEKLQQKQPTQNH